MLVVDDVVTSAVMRAMDGVALRQRVVANNLANAATPGFRAQAVDFEDSLATAISAGRPQDTAITVRSSGTPVKLDGNSVDVTSEVMSLDRASLQFEGLVSALNFKLSTVRAALSR